MLLLPVQLWLVLNAARGRSAAVHRWALAAMAVVILLLLPVTGPQWLGALFPLSALVPEEGLVWCLAAVAAVASGIAKKRRPG